MLGLLKKAGYAITADPGKADVIIVNTCGFIEDAKQESIDTILEMAAYKQAEKSPKLLVTGCLSQRYAEELYVELPEVDGFLGVHDYAHIVPVVETVLSGRRVTGWDAPPCALPMASRLLSTPGYAAYVKIAEGCDNRCSYCAIPEIRGPFVSRAIGDVYDECASLAGRGVKEITLIAQDTTRYGEDREGASLLPDLLTSLGSIAPLRWIRVLYCYPERVTDRLLSAVAGLPKVCNYLDIPIQHIDADILKKMNRKSTPGQIRALYSRIRGLGAGFSLRTTLIAGFPGESEAQFESLCRFIKECPFDHLGAFAFSPEDGTAAAGLLEQVPQRVREGRRDRLMQIQAEVAKALNRRRDGRIYEVLTEGYDPDSGRYFGRTYAQAPEIDTKVFWRAEQGLSPGTFVKVRVTGSEEYDWIGEMTDEPAQ